MIGSCRAESTEVPEAGSTSWSARRAEEQDDDTSADEFLMIAGLACCCAAYLLHFWYFAFVGTIMFLSGLKVFRKRKKNLDV